MDRAMLGEKWVGWRQKIWGQILSDFIDDIMNFQK